MLAGVALVSGCKFAVDHPPATVGIVAGVLGFGTCKLAKDDYAACGLAGAGAGLGLALITAGALWLGGDGHTVMVEEQAQPLPDDGRPVRRRHATPAETPEAVQAVPPLGALGPDSPPATAPGPAAQPAAPATPSPSAPVPSPPAP